MMARTLKNVVGSIAVAISVLAAGCGDDDDDVVTVDASTMVDAGTTPDASATIDARVADAASNPVVGGASLVLGQADFTSGGANAGGIGMASLNRPVGVASGGGRLWISDETNQRVLQWNSAPSVNKTPANLAFGAPDLGAAGRIFSDGVRVIVSDPDNARVLIWNPVPAVDNAPPTLILGAGTAGTSATEMQEPLGVWTDGTRLIVTDAANHRVLIWSSFPTTATSPANVVLGQVDMSASVAPIAASPTALDTPKDVTSAGGKLYVVDSSMNRIMVWNSIPTVNNAPADFVIGQGDLISNGAAAGEGGLNEPAALAIAGDRLFVSDAGNRRVLMYSPIPTAIGAGAQQVFGQDGMEDIDEAALPAANRFIQPRGLTVLNNRLFVADQNWNRVLRFDLD